MAFESWLKQGRDGEWHHREDGTVCPAFMASRTASEQGWWWCTQHQQHVEWVPTEARRRWCAECGGGPHRYSTADPYHEYDPRACIDLLRRRVDELQHGNPEPCIHSGPCDCDDHQTVPRLSELASRRRFRFAWRLLRQDDRRAIKWAFILAALNRRGTADTASRG